MCIAVGKKPGVPLLDEEIWARCFENNPDGCGFCYNYEGKVFMRKGLMTFEAFKEALQSVKDRVDLTQCGMLLHFRIATHGGVNEGNTQPFIISGDEAALHKTAYISDYAMCHNGVISLTSSEAYRRKTISDTGVFVEKYLTKIATNRNWFYNKSNIELIDDLADSKILIMDGSGTIQCTKGFTEENGYLFSNSSYKENYHRKLSGYSYISSAYPQTGYTGYTGSYGIQNLKETECQMSSYRTYKLMRCEVGETIEYDSGSILITGENRNQYFVSEPNEDGFQAIYQRYDDSFNFDADYALYFCDYEYIGFGNLYSSQAQIRDFVGNVTVYGDQFVGGWTPPVALEEAYAEYSEEELEEANEEQSEDCADSVVISATVSS